MIRFPTIFAPFCLCATKYTGGKCLKIYIFKTVLCMCRFLQIPKDTHPHKQSVFVYLWPPWCVSQEMTRCPYLHPFITDTLDYVQDIGLLRARSDYFESEMRGKGVPGSSGSWVYFTLPRSSGRTSLNHIQTRKGRRYLGWLICYLQT